MSAFWILLRSREALDPVKNCIDWQQFQSLASELISPSIQIHSSEEAHKAAHNFAAPIALIYRPSPRKTIILDYKCKLPSLDCLLKHKKKLSKIMARNRGSSMQNGSKLGH
jgi:hypothetical protein